MKQKIIIVILIGLVYGCCINNTPTPTNILSGKLKSITLYDSTVTSVFNLKYDTLNGKLKIINVDTIGSIIFITSNNIINIESNFIGKDRRLIKAYLNSNHKIETIKYVDNITNVESVIYRFVYNNIEKIDTITEPDKLFFITNFKNITNFNFFKTGDNYSSFNKAFVVENLFGGSINYDTLSYGITYSLIENNNQIPFQTPTSYTPLYVPLEDLELLSLYDNTLFNGNKHLIKNISIINKLDTNFINYDYTIITNKIVNMAVNGKRTFSFEYY